MPNRPNYGLDSPAIITGLALLAVLGIGTAFLLRLVESRHFILELFFLVGGIYFLLGAGSMVWYSKVGKLRIRNEILKRLPWRGDESVLDVGCGRGLLLISAAHQ